jgi:hypothetical protein
VGRDRRLRRLRAGARRADAAGVPGDPEGDRHHSIESISGKDLEITKENDKVVIRFAYDKEIELIKPVYLLVKYEGQSK